MITARDSADWMMYHSDTAGSFSGLPMLVMIPTMPLTIPMAASDCVSTS